MADLHFRTANYLLRPLTPADITEDWGAWLADPTAAELLNAPCRKLSRRELEGYLQRFDNKTRILLGIFHRPSGTHIGIFTIMESTDGLHALINIFIGAAGFATIGGLIEIREIRTTVGDFLFFDRAYRSLTASVVGSNGPMISYLRLEGYQLVKRSKTRRANGSASVELLTFRLTRERYIERNGRASPAQPPHSAREPTTRNA
jgi:hypothetical protein